MTGLDAILSSDLALNHQRLIRTRWIAGVTVLVAVFVSVYLLGLALPQAALIALAVFILAYNVLLQRVSRDIDDEGLLRRLIQIQVIPDWLSMAVFIHLTGGIVSPALVFFFLHVIMVTILLPGQSPYIYVTAVLVALGALALLEANGTLPHYVLLPDLQPTLHSDPGFIVTRLVFFAVAMYAAAYITASIMRPLRERERQLAALFRTVQAVSSSLDLDAVLQQLALNTCEALHADGAAIRLLSRDHRSLERTAACGVGVQAVPVIPVSGSYQHVIAGECQTHSPGDEFENPPPGISAALLVPIMGERPLGVLAIYSRRPYSPEALRLARAVADEGAVAIQHALAHQALQRAEAQREQFTRIFTHELRAPVTGSQSLLRVMLAQMAGDLNPRQVDMLQRLNKRMDSLLLLINDLLSLAEGRAQELQQEYSPIDLTSALKQVINDQLYPAQSKHVQLTTALDNLPLPVLATETGLKRIFDNLLGNAVKYTPEKGCVHVSVTHTPEAARVTIRDTGIGIPQEALDKLGQEFYRAPNAKDSGVVGTGLGLATVRQLIENFGGEMQVESTVGEGTAFTVILPLVQSPEKQP